MCFHRIALDHAFGDGTPLTIYAPDGTAVCAVAGHADPSGDDGGATAATWEVARLLCRALDDRTP